VGGYIHNLDSNFQIPFLSFKLYEKEKVSSQVFFPQKQFKKKNHNQKLPIQNHITKITKIAKNSCLVWCFLVVNLDVFLFAFLLFLYLMMVMMMMMKELYNMLGCGFFLFCFVWVFWDFERLRD
jgi:ATP-dependent Zn protease